MNKPIFISKPIQEVAELAEFCKKNEFLLHAKSLVHFESVAFEIKDTYDVLFFSSIRSATFFLERNSVSPTISIACMGQITANKLIDLGLKIDFIGENAGKPYKVAQKFYSWLGTRTVLIPQSNISKRSIARIIPAKQLVEVVVYRTLHDCKPISKCDIYVFTSPSNFESFMSCNEAPKGKIIAWGETTKSAIEAKGFRVDETLESASELELIFLCL